MLNMKTGFDIVGKINHLGKNFGIAVISIIRSPRPVLPAMLTAPVISSSSSSQSVQYTRIVSNGKHGVYGDAEKRKIAARRADCDGNEYDDKRVIRFVTCFQVCRFLCRRQVFN